MLPTGKKHKCQTNIYIYGNAGCVFPVFSFLICIMKFLKSISNAGLETIARTVP
uniref:Uncharacterized protein n=1 Tax=Anguilla anguilla TaxID=7936 RepID=A0A0E9UIP5_ANGAN